jgi:hypothetical protein
MALPVASFEAGIVLIVVALLTIPVAGIVFASGAGKALKEVGKGDFAIEQQMPSAGTGPVRAASRAEREEEIRQMLEARAYRAEVRGDKPVDVDAELKKLLALDTAGPSLGEDKELRVEVTQLVVARNERRERAGKKPLDIEKEVERQLRELENLGQ